MNPLDRTRLEKTLADHGFDLTPVVDGDWLVGRSTLHPVAVSLRQNADASHHPSSSLLINASTKTRDLELPCTSFGWSMLSNSSVIRLAMARACPSATS